MDFNTIPRASTRLGFHYFNDSLHYRESDLLAWLPEIKACGASWLTLVAPHDRAIPEAFIRGVIQEKIEPVLHFKLTLPHLPDMKSMKLLFDIYSDWGVRYAVLYDRPNRRSSWDANSWVQNDLVERFLDIYLPVADLALGAGLTPVFPALEPGGDYWDTAFLRAALAGIKRRGQDSLAERIVLGAYAWADTHHLGWGAGGPERWPKAKPYHTPGDQEDQRGFYIPEWYLAIAEAELGKPRPVILLAMGFPPAARNGSAKRNLDMARHTEVCAAIARLMMGHSVENPAGGEPLTPPSAHVLAGSFWLLAAEIGSPDSDLAWFHPLSDGAAETNLPIVTAMRQLVQNPGARLNLSANGASSPANHPINHYLLLPEDWLETNAGVPEYIWDYLMQHRATVGFTLEEALLAARVTVVGSDEQFPEAALESIRLAGAEVERLRGDGISIAPTQPTHDPV